MIVNEDDCNNNSEEDNYMTAYAVIHIDNKCCDHCMSSMTITSKTYR